MTGLTGLVARFADSILRRRRLLPDMPYRARFWFATLVTFGVVLGLLATFIGGDRGSFGLCGKPVAASDEFPSDFCYYSDITITNGGSNTYTNFAVRLDDFQTATLIANGTFDNKAWALKPTLGTFQNETDLLVQGINVNTSGAWFHLPTIGASSSQTVRLYMGNNEQKRDPGLLLTGNGPVGNIGGDDGAASPYHADFNISDNLYLTVEVELLDDTAQDGVIAQHWASNTGYSLQLWDDGGTLKLRAVVDNQACPLAWDSSWTDTNRDIQMRFIAPDLSIWVDGVQQASCDTGLGSITNATGSPSFEVSPSGARLENIIIRDIELLSSSAVMARWGFDADQTTETVDTNPFEFTTVDYSGRGHTLTATLDRSQTGLSISFGPVLGVTTASNVTIPTVIPNVLGNPFQPSIVATPGAQQCSDGLWARFWCPAVTGDRIPDQTNWGGIYAGIGLILAVASFIWVMKNVALSLFWFCAVISYGVNQDHLPEYWLVTWILVVGFGWFSLRGGESSAG